MLSHTGALGVFGLIVCVVNQLEKGFFVARVELRSHRLGALLGEEDHRSSAEVFAAPVIMFLIMYFVELSFERLSQKTENLLKVSLHVERSLRHHL